MKRLSTLFLTIFILVSCKRIGDSSVDKYLLKEEVSSLLMTNVKEYYQRQVSEIKNRESMIGSDGKNLNPDWSTAVMMSFFNGETKGMVLSMPDYKLGSDEKRISRKIVFILNNRDRTKVIYSRIVEIIADKQTIARQGSNLIAHFDSGEIDGFNGTILTYDLRYHYLRGRNFLKGKIQNDLPKISDNVSRTTKSNGFNKLSLSAPNVTSSLSNVEAGCSDFYLVTTYPDGTQTWTYLYTKCNGETGNGTPLPGGSPGPAPGETGPGNFGSPPNPYDGQVWRYFYPPGPHSGEYIDFTYHSLENVWMMPEVELLNSRGNEMFYPPNIPGHPGPALNFNGKIMSGLALFAIAEPTFVGEVLWAGGAALTLGLYLYDVVQFMRYMQDDTNRRRTYCLYMWNGCLSKHPSWKCTDCLHYCNVQGEWNREICPNVTERWTW